MTLPSRFHLRVEPEALAPSGRDYTLVADEADRREIATRLGVPEVSRLAGDTFVRPIAHGAEVRGRLRATLQRQCVVSLEPMTEEIEEEFAIRYVKGTEDDAELLIDEETPEPLDGNSIDLGEVLIQQASLAMDPYPRRDGATPPAAPGAGAAESSPFAGLKGLIAEAGDEE